MQHYSTHFAFNKENANPHKTYITQTKTNVRTAFGDISNTFSNVQGREAKKPKPTHSFVSCKPSKNNDEMQLTPIKSTTTVSQYRFDSPQVDLEDKNDPLACYIYIKDIVNYFRECETKYLANPNYMDYQSEITAKMRGVLIDWLVEVHRRFRLLPETLYLCVNLIDRFLSTANVSKSRLQLVGITAMLIACKYEEILVPRVQDFAKIAANVYTTDQILQMERIMLSKLSFSITTATTFVFLQRYLKIANADEKMKWIAFFFAELSLIDIGSLDYKPSEIACAAIYLARRFMGVVNPWNDKLVYYSKYKLTDLIDCSRYLLKLLKQEPLGKLHAVTKKYSSPTRMEVARLCQQLSLIIDV